MCVHPGRISYSQEYYHIPVAVVLNWWTCILEANPEHCHSDACMLHIGWAHIAQSSCWKKWSGSLTLFLPTTLMLISFVTSFTLSSLSRSTSECFNTLGKDGGPPQYQVCKVTLFVHYSWYPFMTWCTYSPKYLLVLPQAPGMVWRLGNFGVTEYLGTWSRVPFICKEIRLQTHRSATHRISPQAYWELRSSRWNRSR